MQRKRDGLVPIGEALADLPGPVQAIREASPQALHHFTQADQVHQLVSASEADPERGFMARMMALKDIPPLTDKEQLARLAGYTFSTVILRALATELMLKVLSFKKTGQYRKDRQGHDLLVLFNDLASSTSASRRCRMICSAVYRFLAILPPFPCLVQTLYSNLTTGPS